MDAGKIRIRSLIRTKSLRRLRSTALLGLERVLRLSPQRVKVRDANDRGLICVQTRCVGLTYLRLLVDVRVHVQTLRVEDDDVPLPDGG